MFLINNFNSQNNKQNHP